MKQDWLKHLKYCAKIKCRYDIQIGHYHYYHGKYNGKTNDRLLLTLLDNHVNFNIPTKVPIITNFYGKFNGYIWRYNRGCSKERVVGEIRNGKFIYYDKLGDWDKL